MKNVKNNEIIPINNGFEPVFDQNSKVLILGSFPSVISRKNQFYYGNLRNHFWDMLSTFYNVSIGSDNQSKIEFLLKYNIALWDVASTCQISGSSDNNINSKNIQPVDLFSVLNNAPKIKYILINGKKAYNLFTKFFPTCPIIPICMPSTSPANVSYNEQVWVDALNKINLQ